MTIFELRSSGVLVERLWMRKIETPTPGRIILDNGAKKPMNKTEDLVTDYVKLWPREVFYVRDSQCVDELKKSLDHPGVYILYLDFDVFYVGQSDRLSKRLYSHATKRYRLWNHFSAFVVPRKEHLDYVEAIIIAATPGTANKKGGRRIRRIDLPKNLEMKLRVNREIR